MSQSAHFNVNCIQNMRQQQENSFDWIRFDSNNDCNLKCVYCHNSRSKELMNLETLESFLSENVIDVQNFQFGCRMEPTLDMRLVDFMKILSNSSAKPTKSIVLQTNGILLHRHDQAAMIDAGLTDLYLSIDTIDPKTFAALRGGAKIEKIQRNLSNFSIKNPMIKVRFIVTVSTLNVDHVDQLVRFGLDHGVQHFVIREMFHHPGNAQVDDNKMEKLVLENDSFAGLVIRLEEAYGKLATLLCINKEGLLEHSEVSQSYSYSNKKSS